MVTLRPLVPVSNVKDTHMTSLTDRSSEYLPVLSVFFAELGCHKLDVLFPPSKKVIPTSSDIASLHTPGLITDHTRVCSIIFSEASRRAEPAI